MSYLDKTLERLRLEVTFNPPGDGDCFFGSAAQQLGLLGIESLSLKTLVFDYLKNRRFDMLVTAFSFRGIKSVT